MNKEEFLHMFKNSVKAITERHYFSTERGYQGRLLAELTNNSNIKRIFPDDPTVEQEYQKTLENHGIRIRPDIIVHIPYERGMSEDRRRGNFVVIQIKLKASESKAKEDFCKIDLMFEKLGYPLGIFLNIDSDTTFFDRYSGRYKDRLHCFAVQLVKNKVTLHESP